jgi:LytS/YehU family sensor histidine kinase
MQLNPHFLFNSLHSIASLMHQDVEAADRMIARLGELLRAALHTSAAQEITLGRELEFLRQYLEIERIRFGSRLSFEIKAPPETLEARVPNLILQPLVENAIRHGVEPHSRPGIIELVAHRNGEGLEIEIWDNGDGLRNGQPAERVGLSNRLWMTKYWRAIACDAF